MPLSPSAFKNLVYTTLRTISRSHSLSETLKMPCSSWIMSSSTWVSSASLEGRRNRSSSQLLGVVFDHLVRFDLWRPVLASGALVCIIPARTLARLLLPRSKEEAGYWSRARGSSWRERASNLSMLGSAPQSCLILFQSESEPAAGTAVAAGSRLAFAW